MARKRLEKKALQRLESLERQLEALARRGADEDFLAVLHGHGRAPLSPGMAGLYAEVVDRALRQALAGGDLPRLDRLVREVRPEVAARPWARLAAAVAHLGEGRLDEARAGLAALRSASPPPEIEAAATALLALCAPGPDAAGIEGPALRALDRVYLSLSALAEQACRPEAVDREGLEGDLGTLRAALSSDPEARKLLDTAQGCLRCLDELADLERELGRNEGDTGAGRIFLERVRHLSGPLLEAFRAGPAAALLQPLVDALRLRWRSVLARVKESGDEAAWTAALAEFPALFAFDVATGGGERAVRLAAQRETLRKLLAAGDLRESARRLAAWGRSETVPEHLARLWSLELWAWERAAAGQDEPERDDFFSDVPPDPPHHAVLVRAAAMAAEVGQRFPAEQRPEVARFLRARLFELLERLFLCEHFLDAAASLLRYLPHDACLLALAVACAAAKEDERALARLVPRIEMLGEAGVAEREPLLRLAVHTAKEPPPQAARILSLLRPLYGPEVWPQVSSLVAKEITELACSMLCHDRSENLLRALLGDLAAFHSVLPESGELAVLEAALGCARKKGDRHSLLHALEAFPGLEPALVALQVLATFLADPLMADRVLTAFEETRETVIRRLDARWRLWRPMLPGLVLTAGKGPVRKLRKRLQQILSSEDLAGQDRQAIAAILDEIQDLQDMESVWRGMGEPSTPGGARRAGKPLRRRARNVQPGLF